MKKIISVLLAIILAFSCVVIACAEDELDWEEIKMGGKRGDVNGDKNITAVDALWVLKYVAGSQDLAKTQTLRADMNQDDKVTAVDARWILQTAAGLTPGK